MTTSPTYPTDPVNPYEPDPRYTTLAAVKAAMGITHADKDDRITTAIVAAEYAIDAYNGGAWPTDVPEAPVPQAIANWALDASIAVYKAGDSPHGQGGSDAWLGSLDIQSVTERVLRHHPLALGFKATWGVA